MCLWRALSTEVVGDFYFIAFCISVFLFLAGTTVTPSIAPNTFFRLGSIDESDMCNVNVVIVTRYYYFIGKVTHFYSICQLVLDKFSIFYQLGVDKRKTLFTVHTSTADFGDYIHRFYAKSLVEWKIMLIFAAIK